MTIRMSASEYAQRIGTKPAPVRRRGVPGKWEASFCAEASAGMVPGFDAFDKWSFEVITFRIGVHRAYTPDWCVRRRDGSIAFVEVKGSRQAKNARDGITRLRVAADLWPEFDWGLAEGGPSRWSVTWINERSKP